MPRNAPGNGLWMSAVTWAWNTLSKWGSGTRMATWPQARSTTPSAPSCSCGCPPISSISSWPYLDSAACELTCLKGIFLLSLLMFSMIFPAWFECKLKYLWVWKCCSSSPHATGTLSPHILSRFIEISLRKIDKCTTSTICISNTNLQGIFI